MADIKQIIDDNIYQNGQQRITGRVMNSVLNAMVDDVNNKIKEIGEFTDVNDLNVEGYEDKRFVAILKTKDNKFVKGIDEDGYEYWAKLPPQIKDALDKYGFSFRTDVAYKGNVLVWAIVDSNDGFLFGFDENGEAYFGVGVPSELKTYIQTQINSHIPSVVSGVDLMSLLEFDKTILLSNGSYQTHSSYIGYATTKFLRIVDNTIVVNKAYQGTSATPVVFYDANFNFLSAYRLDASYNGKSSVFTITEIPSNAKYIKVTLKIVDFSTISGVLGLNDSFLLDYLSKHTTQSNDIIVLNDRSKLDNAFKNLKRPELRGTTAQTEPLVLLHFSDIHGDGARLARVMEVANTYNNYIDDVICTGDIIAGNYSDSFDFWHNNGADKVLMTIGNHDTSVSGVTGAESKVNVYTKFLKPYISQWGVVQPNGAESNGLNYYYKDYPTQRVRLICVDSVYVDAAQVSWFESRLNEVLDSNNDAYGYHVVVAEHYPIYGISPIESSFDTLQYRWWITTQTWNTLAPLNAKVDAFINSGGNFVCWLAGHTHVDHFMMGKQGNTNGSYTYAKDQLCINISCASTAQSYAWTDEVREIGTKSEDCINAFSIDTHKNYIRIYRIGVDRDRNMRHKGTICYDYVNKKVIWNE